VLNVARRHAIGYSDCGNFQASTAALIGMPVHLLNEIVELRIGHVDCATRRNLISAG
jgi:hypothetical protein